MGICELAYVEILGNSWFSVFLNCVFRIKSTDYVKSQERPQRSLCSFSAHVRLVALEFPTGSCFYFPNWYRILKQSIVTEAIAFSSCAGVELASFLSWCLSLFSYQILNGRWLLSHKNSNTLTFYQSFQSWKVWCGHICIFKTNSLFSVQSRYVKYPMTSFCITHPGWFTGFKALSCIILYAPCHNLKRWPGHTHHSNNLRMMIQFKELK